MTLWLLAVLGSYFVGGVPIGLLVGRARGIDDIRKYGSGNIGASNVLRLLGVKAGLFVWLADVAKGFVPVMAARAWLVPQAALARAESQEGAAWLAAVALAAMLGHCYSPYLRFSGGRGVSTSLGVVLGIDWRVGLICFGLWIVVVALTRYISLGSMIGSAMAGPLFYVFNAAKPFVIAGFLIALIVIVRHRPNIQRLLAGTERKIGQREAVPPPEAEETP